MQPSSKFLLALAFTLAVGVRAHSRDISRGQFQAVGGNGASAHSAITESSAPSTLANHREVTRYATEFDGDHSLDAAIVAEQAFARYSLYTVRLQFASGAEQSILVTAPPGGLQPEMRDMTGDSVPNDVVLTSKLLHSTLIVLLNEGHDHLTVAISPSSFSSGEGRASGPRQTHRTSALLSSRFKTAGLTNVGGLLRLRLQENLLPTIAQFVTKYLGYTSTSGRAPPALVTKIYDPS